MTTRKPKPVLLIDGDVVAFKISVTQEVTTHWGDGVWTLHSDMKTAGGAFAAYVEDLEASLGAEDSVIMFSDSPTFRHKLNPSYKANRIGKRKPLVYPMLIDYACENYMTDIRPGLEADDLLGIWQTDPRGPDESIIVTIDKDLKTIPGKHYNPDKPELGVVEVTAEEAFNFFLLQSITGDSVDGYKGIPGYGPVKATKALEAGGYCWDTVVATYKKAGLSEEVALENARMARILTWDLWDDAAEQPMLWGSEEVGVWPRS